MDYWCAITQNSSYGTLSLKNTVIRKLRKIAGTFEFSCVKGKNSNYWSLIFDAKIRTFFFKYLKWHNLLTLLYSNIDFWYEPFLIYKNIAIFWRRCKLQKREYSFLMSCQETKAWKMMGFSFNWGGWGGCIFIDVIMSYYYVHWWKNKAFITWSKKVGLLKKEGLLIENESQHYTYVI